MSGEHDRNDGLPPLLAERLKVRPDARALIREVLAIVERETGADAVERWARAFDAAARRSPEAAVAIYSLGDPALLEAATAEIVAALRRWGVLGRERMVLDVGCGIGRISAALEREVRFIVGLDISQEMLRLARERAPRAGLVRVGGRDLSALRDEAFDLALVVDAMPYAVEAGLECVLVAELARVLRPGGDLIVLNWAYRGDIGRNIADCRALAAKAGLDVLSAGERPFTRWDGTEFRLRKPG